MGLVTGGAGFISSHIVDEVLRRGEQTRAETREGDTTRWPS